MSFVRRFECGVFVLKIDIHEIKILTNYSLCFCPSQRGDIWVYFAVTTEIQENDVDVPNGDTKLNLNGIIYVCAIMYNVPDFFFQKKKNSAIFF